MMDYQLQGNTRRCAISGKELVPGEKFYGVLLVEQGKFVRMDVSESSWTGPPDGTLGYWKGRINDGNALRRPPIDDDLLLECCHRLEGETDENKLAFRYVLALLLLRRKRLRLDGMETIDGKEVMHLRCTRKGERYHVVDPALSDHELELVQDDVFRVLGWD